MLRACWHDLRMRQGYVYILASQRNGTLYTRRNVEVYPRHLKVKAVTETASPLRRHSCACHRNPAVPRRRHKRLFIASKRFSRRADARRLDPGSRPG